MSRSHHIAVCGLGRCGSTLLMHMLHAAGIPCIGGKPAFEHDQFRRKLVDREFLAAHPGHAFKLLDPHLVKLPAGITVGKAIWLDRDVEQQARSQAKFVHLLEGVPLPNRAQLRHWKANLRGDREKALRALPWLKLFLSFESLIEAPTATAAKLAAALHPVVGELDAGKMAAVVHRRSTACAEGLDIESILLAEAEAA